MGCWISWAGFGVDVGVQGSGRVAIKVSRLGLAEILGRRRGIRGGFPKHMTSLIMRDKGSLGPVPLRFNIELFPWTDLASLRRDQRSGQPWLILYSFSAFAYLIIPRFPRSKQQLLCVRTRVFSETLSINGHLGASHCMHITKSGSLLRALGRTLWSFCLTQPHKVPNKVAWQRPPFYSQQQEGFTSQAPATMHHLGIIRPAKRIWTQECGHERSIHQQPFTSNDKGGFE